LNLADLTSISPASQSSTHLTPQLDVGIYVPITTVPSYLVEHIKLLVGVQGTAIVFLDHEGWLTTWDVTTASDLPQTDADMPVKQAGASANSVHHHHTTVECDIEGIEGLMRHFFAPKDWLNTNTSHLTVVHGQGTLFCPRYGEVAIVRNGMRL
jgi:hypothetical protein